MAFIKASIENLHPAYFAMVMATGIISIAAHMSEWDEIALPLCALNLIFFVALWLLTAARLFWHRGRVVADLLDHNRAPGFFTMVAASCILGNQWLTILSAERMALWLWISGIALWLVLTYTIFTALTVKENKPALAEGINGGWLVAVVATQAVSVLGARLAQLHAHIDETGREAQPGEVDNVCVGAEVIADPRPERRDPVALDEQAAALIAPALRIEQPRVAEKSARTAHRITLEHIPVAGFDSAIPVFMSGGRCRKTWIA